MSTTAPSTTSLPSATGASSSTALQPPTSPTPDPNVLRSFEMVFTGDVILHNRVNRLGAELAIDDETRSWDFRPMLEPIRHLVSNADWAVCQLETTLSADGTRLSGFPRFRGPGQIADDLADVGYDACTTANNHTLDFGVDGVVETLDVLEASGLHATGSARSEAEKVERVWLDLGGVKVAHHAYAYGFNGWRIPPDAPWTSNTIDEETILADAAGSKAAGAEYVVVSLHWGSEDYQPLTSQQSQLGPALIASPDIDAIVGHHAHVVQRIDLIEGEWLVYGIGNLLSNQPWTNTRDELLVRLTVTEVEGGGFDSSLELVPLYVDWATLTVFPTDPLLRPDDISTGLAAEFDASRRRLRSVLEAGSAWGSFDWAEG
ncbi:MAG: CapA family protein [Actinomycetia bacterium]|nr:CapA family protein [Actinomycetes bacterium]